MTQERFYKTEVLSSSKELTKREKIKFSMDGNYTNLNDLEAGTKLNVTGYVELFITNGFVKEEDGRDKEYKNFLVITEDHTYKTGSETFIRNFKEIWEIMQPEEGEGVEIEIVLLPSKNYKGQNILSCNIV